MVLVTLELVFHNQPQPLKQLSFDDFDTVLGDHHDHLAVVLRNDNSRYTSLYIKSAQGSLHYSNSVLDNGSVVVFIHLWVTHYARTTIAFGNEAVMSYSFDDLETCIDNPQLHENDYLATIRLKRRIEKVLLRYLEPAP